MDQLEFVKNKEEIRQSLTNFNKQARDYQDRACLLVRQTTYWVYDPRQDAFGPNKFVAYKNMTFSRYENALGRNYSGAQFDGGAARRAIEASLEPYEDNSDLGEQLVEWAESLLSDGVLDNIAGHKWRFVSLP